MNFESWRMLVTGGAAVGQTLFMLFFMFAPWWRGHVGRALFIVNLALCLLIDTIAYRVFFAEDSSPMFAVFAYGTVAIAIWYQLVVLLLQRRKTWKIWWDNEQSKQSY